MATTTAAPIVKVIGATIQGKSTRLAYEHPRIVRFAHWLNAISLFVLIGSGLRIFLAFPSLGPRIPQKDFLIQVPPAFTIGGWLGGALKWHLTFVWIFVGTGIAYIVYQVVTGHYRQVLFTHRDLPGVWPMARHYFFFGAKPEVKEPYNALQKLAYTSTIFFGAVATLSGFVLYKPVQLAWLGFLMGGYHLARVWHFAAMFGFLAFIPGHLIMVLVHGWNNFFSMLTGWKKNPEYSSH
jgi:thiosulfate reductase cytochrome b subunit